MDNCIDILSDDSSSDKTVVLENDELDYILKKYNTKTEMLTNNITSVSVSTKVKNIYNLDEFSDEEFNCETLETRIKGQNLGQNTVTETQQHISNMAWQSNFSTDDYCEDSNDLDMVLNRISQLQSEQFENEPKQTFSKEVETLFTGKIIASSKHNNLENCVNEDKYSSCHNSFSSDEGCSSDLNGFNLKFEIEKIKNSVVDHLKQQEIETNLKKKYSDDSPNIEDMLDEPKPKKIKKKNASDKEAERIEKELERAAKAKEKEQKKIEKETEKQKKNALKVVENCIKPDQCIQYLTVNIDDNISSKHYGEVIKAGLKSGGYNYKASEQLVPDLISWTRKVPTIENMFLQNIYQQEKHYLLIIEITDFLQHVHNSTLCGHIQSILSLSPIEHLSIAILGLQRYYKYLRDVKNKEYKAAVSDVENRKNTNNVEFKDSPHVSKKEIDMSLVQVQIFCKNTYIRPVEKFEDLAMFVCECTKSVAQIPYKLAKAESFQQENELFSVNNRDCVRVDKDGNGLSRLWNQFLRMFPLANLEIAEAVTNVYPTMHCLMEVLLTTVAYRLPKHQGFIQAYKNCLNPLEAEKLLQDLPIRRAAGPLGGQRKLGPEFSKKAYKFFCSEENVLL